jgi:DNA-binding FrmR family transcriptional regulator
MEDLKTRLKVIEGHSASVHQQIEELNRFISEVSAISTYGEKGMVEVKIQPILLDIVNRLATINGSINVILEEASLEEKEEQKG